MRATTNIFGYHFICDATYEALAEEIVMRVRSGQIGITNMITPNAHGINMYYKYPALNAFCKTSEYVLPDGQPIVWLSKLTPAPIKKRLTGSDFFPVIFGKLKTPEHRCLFVVSNDTVKQKLKPEKPDAVFVIPEFFSMEDQEKISRAGDTITQQILEKKLNYVFIGISEPKQGALAQNVTMKLKAAQYKEPCIFFFLGASYEFYFGLKKRAPVIFQKTGLEWFYRLITEPRRMYRRYIFGNLLFVARSVKWLLNKKYFN